MKSPLPLLLSAILLLHVTNGTAQTNIDSLKKEVLAARVTDMIQYRTVGSSYARAGNFDSALYFLRLGHAKSLVIKSEYWKTKYTLWIGGMYANTATYDSAAKYLDEGFTLAQQLKNDSLIAQYYQNKGSVAQFQNDNDKAIEYLLKSIEVMEAMGEKRPLNLLPHAYQDLSGIYNNTGMHAKAAEYDQKSLAVQKDIQDGGDRAKMYYNVAVTFNYLRNDEKFKLYLDSAALVNKEHGNARVGSGILAGYGVFFEHRNQWDSALKYHREALELTKKSQDFYFFAERAISTASSLSRLGRNAEAQDLLEQAVDYAGQFQDYQMLAEAYKLKKEIARQQGNYKEALHFSELYKQYADSVTNTSTQQTIVSLEAKYQNQQKEKSIAELKAQNAENELGIVKRNRLLIAGSIAAAAAVLIVLLLYRSSRQKQLLAQKEKEVKEQQVIFLEKQQQVVSMQSMINGQESERTRIAKDLHDGLGGLFSTIKMYFSTLQHEVGELKQNELFQKSIGLLSTASSEIRRIAHNMMPESLLKLGLINAVKDLCDHTSAGRLINVNLEVHGMNRRVNPSTEIMLYRIIQELLNNIIKHAQATEAIIQFVRDENRLSVVVEDNGRGFSMEPTDKSNVGMDSVKSRVTYLNGKMSIDSQNGMGTTVMMDFLLDD
jgi:two-component system, NarL family, sensor kinase